MPDWQPGIGGRHGGNPSKALEYLAMESKRTHVDTARAKAAMLDTGAVGITARVERYWHTFDQIMARTGYRPFVFDVRGNETEISTDPAAENFLCIRVPTVTCYDFPKGTNANP